MSQGQNTQRSKHQRCIAVLQPRSKGQRRSTSAKPHAGTAALRSIAAQQSAIAVASELAMARRDVETKAALLSKAADEAAQLRQTAEATAAELRQSLLQERDRVAALARELATARRDLETEVALSRKAGEEAEQLRQAAKATTAELEQERNRSAALARDPEPAQRVIGARSTTERPAGSPIIDQPGRGAGCDGAAAHSGTR